MGTMPAEEAPPPPLTMRFPLTCLGVTSESFADALAAFARDNPEGALRAPAGTKVPLIHVYHAFFKYHLLSLFRWIHLPTSEQSIIGLPCFCHSYGFT